MPQFDVGSVVVKVKPKETTELDLLYSAGKLLDKAQLAVRRNQSNAHNLAFFRTLIQSLVSTNKKVLDSYNTGGMTLMQKGADYGLDQFVKVLLDHGADPNSELKENSDKPVLL